MGAKGVNDTKNLVAACESCNASKGPKMGTWLIRGMLGKYKSYWISLRVLQLLIIAVAIWLLVSGEYQMIFRELGSWTSSIASNIDTTSITEQIKTLIEQAKSLTR